MFLNLHAMTKSFGSQGARTSLKLTFDLVKLISNSKVIIQIVSLVTPMHRSHGESSGDDCQV